MLRLLAEMNTCTQNMLGVNTDTRSTWLKYCMLPFELMQYPCRTGRGSSGQTTNAVVPVG